MKEGCDHCGYAVALFVFVLEALKLDHSFFEQKDRSPSTHNRLQYTVHLYFE